MGKNPALGLGPSERKRSGVEQLEMGIGLLVGVSQWISVSRFVFCLEPSSSGHHHLCLQHIQDSRSHLCG